MRSLHFVWNAVGDHEVFMREVTIRFTLRRSLSSLCDKWVQRGMKGNGRPISELLQQSSKKCCCWTKLVILTRNPAILLLGIYPGKTMIQKDTCTPVFTDALFTIVRIWEQPKYTITDERIKKMWEIYVYTHIYNGILFSHTKEQNLVICREWMGLEMVIQRDVCQK